MENSAEKVQPFEKAKIKLPNTGPLHLFDISVQKKISQSIYQSIKKDLPKLVSEGMTSEQLKELIDEYQLPHSLISDYQKCRGEKKKSAFYFFVSLFTKS